MTIHIKQWRTSAAWVTSLAVVLVAAGATVQNHPARNPFTTFDAPGAGTSAGQGTFPWGIIQGGWVMGYYIDAVNVYHGFLRSPSGSITEFEPPDAGTDAGQGAIEVYGMNPARKIAGTSVDANNVHHGFLRTPHGEFTMFDAPSAGTAPGQGTGSLSMNPAGVILGAYLDASYVYHGLLRAPDGTITPFDPPDAGTVGAYQGTYPAIGSGINAEGASVGDTWTRTTCGIATYVIALAASRSLTLVARRAPARSASTRQGRSLDGYFDTNTTFHGYLRTSHGTIAEFDAPGAGTGTYQGTNACWFTVCWGGINPVGTITGFYVDQNYVYHGYVRTREGEFTTFDVPGAGKGAWQGTAPASINPEGAITGFYTDKDGVIHGFLRPAERPWNE